MRGGENKKHGNKRGSKDESLRDELFRLEPKIDLLHDLLGYGRYAQVHYDGQVFLGMRHGDIGFNDFLGKPSEVALARTRVLLERMTRRTGQGLSSFSRGSA